MLKPACGAVLSGLRATRIGISRLGIDSQPKDLRIHLSHCSRRRDNALNSSVRAVAQGGLEPSSIR
jgi:hypothetical protein